MSSLQKAFREYSAIQDEPGAGPGERYTVLFQAAQTGAWVWHCHILGHEENYFMRPIVFHANEAVPLAPTNPNLR